MSEIRELKDRLKMLMNQRSSMEAEALEITERLNAPGQPGLSGGLIDKEVRNESSCHVICGIYEWE